MSLDGKLQLAIIGCGYWSKNIIRNLLEFDDVELKYVVDNNVQALEKIKNLPHYTQKFTDYNVVLADKDVDAVLIITSVSTHYQIAKDAILAGKAVYVQKPCVETVLQAIELTDLAAQKNVKLMTAFTYIYHSVIQEILKRKRGNAGYDDLYYYDSTRINLGIIQRDCNVLFDLFCHDAAILYSITKELPEYISATGSCHNSNGFIDVANVSLGYKNGFSAHCHCNWVSPIKNRTIILAGKEIMAVFDDCSNEALKIYDTGFSPNKSGVFDYRVGDIITPKLDKKEAIHNELSHFFDCIKNDKPPITDGHFSINVIKMVEMADKSVKMNGAPVSAV